MGYPTDYLFLAALIALLMFPFTPLIIPQYCKEYPFRDISLSNVVGSVAACAFVTAGWARSSELRRQHRARFLKYRLGMSTRTIGGSEVSLLEKLFGDIASIESFMGDCQWIENPFRRKGEPTILGVFIEIENAVKAEGRFFHLDHPLGENLNCCLKGMLKIARSYDKQIAKIKSSVMKMVTEAIEDQRFTLDDIRKDFSISPLSAKNETLIIERNFTVMLLSAYEKKAYPEEKPMIKPVEDTYWNVILLQKYGGFLEKAENVLGKDAGRCIGTIRRYKGMADKCRTLFKSLISRDAPDLFQGLRLQ